mmetsp:Transcript_83926/g.246110  ORF Transcript_83926/g.246110 Transcript_83926/m.246110 type:complete len:308 (-) Transcript_83926:81-1004(-)
MPDCLHLGGRAVAVRRRHAAAAGVALRGEEAEGRLQPPPAPRKRAVAEADVALADAPQRKLELGREVALVGLGAEEGPGGPPVQAVEQAVSSPRVRADGVLRAKPLRDPVLQRPRSAAHVHPLVVLGLVVCLPHRDGPLGRLPQHQNVRLLPQDARLLLPREAVLPGVIHGLGQPSANLLSSAGTIQARSHRAQDPLGQLRQRLHAAVPQAGERLQDSQDGPPGLNVRRPQRFCVRGLQRQGQMPYRRSRNSIKKRCVMDSQARVSPRCVHNFLDLKIVDATYRRSRKRRHQRLIAQSHPSKRPRSI